MRWEVDGYRLVRISDTGERSIPDAQTIYSLSAEEQAVLPVRLSRLGGSYIIKLDFVSNEIVLSLCVQRGRLSIDISSSVVELPDSITSDGVWYNLLENYSDTKLLLTSASVEKTGKIALNQYIRLIREAARFPEAQLVDNAHEALSNHPTEDLSRSMPAQLKATLYPYQQQGFQWLRFIAEGQCGCILGDEMGLGKTLQVIALITDRLQKGSRPTLVVAPVSLLENWKREIAKFTTGVRVLVHHGVNRTGLYTELINYDVVIISYNTAVSDQGMLQMVDWDLLVLDEAQNIKNPSASRTRSVKRIHRHTAIAVSGTPFENHVSDLWSLLDFIAPGCFGKLSEFEADISDDVEGARKIESFLTPLMIRRRVSEVAQDLPERIDIPQVLSMPEIESAAYEEEREKILAQYNGQNASLPMLQKLRMFCTHPDLLADELSPDPEKASGKYTRLCELLEEIIGLREKVILFTSYNRMFDILMDDIPKRFGIKVMAINGSTPTGDRQGIIDDYSAIQGTALLILNPRAAGTGLNITAATRVIHYNLEWNPSLEDQASARAYRRGQTKTVFVYRLFYKDTVEQIINERIDKKRDMFSAAVVGVDGTQENREDIMRALMISPGGDEND